MFNLLLELGGIKGTAGKLLAHKTDRMMALVHAVSLLIKIKLKSHSQVENVPKINIKFANLSTVTIQNYKTVTVKKFVKL